VAETAESHNALAETNLHVEVALKNLHDAPLWPLNDEERRALEIATESLNAVKRSASLRMEAMRRKIRQDPTATDTAPTSADKEVPHG
jgi:hypothetical protein